MKSNLSKFDAKILKTVGGDVIWLIFLNCKNVKNDKNWLKREKAPFEGAKFNILGWLPLIWGTTDVFAKFQLVLTSKSEFMIFFR